jgi:alkylation response protein AidB-like acyl-CoA dehydrogenase
MDSVVEKPAGYTLPAEVVEYRDLARKIVHDEMLPLEPKYLAHKGAAYGLQPLTNLRRVYPKEITDRLEKIARDTGLWYLMVPKEYSGLDMSTLARMVVIEEFMYCAVPFPFVNVPNILYQCRGDQIERYLKPAIKGTRIHCFAQTEPNAGSDPGGMMKTAAVPKGNGWVINGTKMWISGAAESDFILVQAVTDPEKRQRGGITMFIVERNNPGVKVVEPGIPTWLGSTASTYIVNFDDCYVDSTAVLGDVGNGFRLGQKWLTIHDRLMRGPYSLGKMQRALDMSRDWAKQRITFGKPLSERQAIQWRLVEMFVDISALRAMTYDVASRADAGDDVRAEAAMVKMCASEWGTRCLDHAIQIHGAMGESLELPLTLFYRYLRHYQIGGGSNEIQRMLIARKILQ